MVSAYLRGILVLKIDVKKLTWVDKLWKRFFSKRRTTLIFLESVSVDVLNKFNYCFEIIGNPEKNLFKSSPKVEMSPELFLFLAIE